MRKILIFSVFVSAFLILHSTLLTAGDSVIPASLTITNVRDEAVAYATDTYFFEDTTLRFTNCVLFAGTTTNAAKQGLSVVTIQLKAGTATTSTAYTGTAQVESNGTWSCDLIVPAYSGTCYLQVKITDSSTNSYIYPWKILNHKPPL